MAELYTQFDGEEIDGKRYKLGEAVSRDLDAGTVRYLIDTGRLSDTAPLPADSGTMIPPLREPELHQMTRAELETAARNSLDLSDLSDDDLRRGIERNRSASRGEPIDGDQGLGMEGDGSTPREPAPAPNSGATELAAILAGSVPSIEKAIATETDREKLQALHDMEAGAQNRTTALAAIDERLKATAPAE
jgi:hypothetical protein